MQRAVAQWLTDQGLQPEFVANRRGPPQRDRSGRERAWANLTLNGHVDTVLAAQGWSCDPWQGRRDGDRFYGLGAADMKSGVAAAMLATRALDRARDRWRGTVIFTSVVDEEAYSLGARALVAMGLQADACIVTEPSLPHPVIGAVGKVLIRADITGKAAHGSMPHEGINAAVEAARLVGRLDELPLGQHPHLRATQAVLSFHSGSDQYVITVPEQARFLINRHIVPGETGELILAEMRTLADSLNSPARFDFAIDPPCIQPGRSIPSIPSCNNSPVPTPRNWATRQHSATASGSLIAITSPPTSASQPSNSVRTATRSTRLMSGWMCQASQPPFAWSYA